MDYKLNNDTISAIATPIGEGGIGIIKISGPDALGIAQKLFKPRKSVRHLQSHRLYHGWILAPDSGDILDEVLLSYMAAPCTYTREDVVEINCHSGYQALNSILEMVLKSGSRLADPGEFTRRAFLNGRIDLSQAEAVLDVIHSRSQQSLLLANRQLRGDYRDTILDWRNQLFQMHAEAEAFIDFSDELDGEDGNDPSLLRTLHETLIEPLKEMIASYESGKLLREGLKLVLVGKPNVGKSSLLNVLVGKQRAIVTSFPGTTRDVVEDSFLLSGVLVRILDTAGIRTKPDTIESMGIERTISSVAEADVVLWLIDRSQPLSDEDDRVFRTISGKRHIILLNKCDLPQAVSLDEVKRAYESDAHVLELSVFDPFRLEELRGYLSDTFLRRPLAVNRSAIVSNLRHRLCFESALASLLRASQLAESGGYTELISLEILAARKELDSVLGLEADEDLLDTIFSNFCIGK